MSWESKPDFCGLGGGTSPVLKVKSANPNNSSQYLEKLGQNGAIAATKLFGTKNASPSNEYTILKAGDIVVQIGKVTTVDGKRYSLASVAVKKTAGGEPTVSATAVRIEDTTDGEDQVFEAVTLHVDPEETAEFAIGTNPVSGDDCEVTEVTTTVSGTVSPHAVNGDPVASGVHSGKVEVDITVGQYGENEPAFADDLGSSSGFEKSAIENPDEPDSDLPSWTVKYTKPLAKATAASQTAASQSQEPDNNGPGDAQ